MNIYVPKTLTSSGNLICKLFYVDTTLERSKSSASFMPGLAISIAYALVMNHAGDMGILPL